MGTAVTGQNAIVTRGGRRAGENGTIVRISRERLGPIYTLRFDDGQQLMYPAEQLTFVPLGQEEVVSFEFTGEPLTLDTAVHEAVGAASVCWTESPQGVFDEQQARDIATKLLAFIRAERTAIIRRELEAFLGRHEYDDGPVDPEDITQAADIITQALTA
jgi:hypothetical protein